jgi:hypothetical protein
MIELRDGLIQFEQFPTQLKQRHHLARQTAQRLGLFESKMMRLEIHDTQCSERITLACDERHAAIEFEMRLVRDKGELTETRILPEIWCNDEFRSADGGRAERDFTWTLAEVRRQAIFGL